MRQVQPKQLQLGEIEIARIQLDTRSRDDVPQILFGLQHLYTNKKVRSLIFSLLEELLPHNVSSINGRPGMHLWRILVLGVLRLNLNWDYDRLREMANQHSTIRQMLGHGFDDREQYKLQTIKDNVSLFTPELLGKINEVVVAAGHDVVGKKKETTLKGRCDSFVLETHVHFPTDLNLLLDGVIGLVRPVAKYCAMAGITEWRQSECNLGRLKSHYRVVQKLRHSTSKDPIKKAQREHEIQQACLDYLKKSQTLILKAKNTLGRAGFIAVCPERKRNKLNEFINHGIRQMDQIKRRIIDDESIPHSEKVFSLHQPHTEWISKGKAGVPVELGLRVAILEDQYGFILGHRVMEKQTDDQIAVDIVKSVKVSFSDLNSCSFDKGFHSKANQKELREHLDQVVLPKKGRCNREEAEWENSPEFRAAKRQHSAVESAINALEVHGLDKCLDHGIEGLKRYTAMAVLGRNIQKLGAEIQKQRQKEAKRKKNRKLKACG